MPIRMLKDRKVIFKRVVKWYYRTYGKINHSYPPNWITIDHNELIKEAYDRAYVEYGDLAPVGRIENKLRWILKLPIYIKHKINRMRWE